MATTISSSNSDVGTNHQYLGFIIGQKKHFNFVVVDSVTSELISNAFVEGDEVKEFVEDISHIFNQKFKAVFLNVGEYQSEVYPKSYDFCKELKAALNLCNIPNHFFTHLQWCLSGLLISSGYIPTIDQYVLFVTQFGDEANVICYKYTQNGYANVATKDVDISESRDDENICADILQLCPNPSISIIKANAATMKRFKKLLKNLKIFSVPQDFSIVDPKYITEHSKWFFDRSFSNFHVLPVPSSMVKLFVQDGSQEFSFIVISNHAQLPVSHSRTVQKIVNYCCVSMNKEIILEKCLPDQKAHQHNVTLSIDEEGFVDYKVEAILLPHVHILQYKLTTNLKSGIPVITFIENLSFICIKKDGKTDYEYLESWNGKFGMDLYISFDEEKPKYCQDALEVARTEPTFSVFDIFMIMTMAPENIEVLKNYQFKIIKNTENPVLLEFDNFDGTQKAASPAFLMALLLKQHLKAIKNETGKKPKEIAFSTFAQLNVDEMKRVKKQLNESCEMLKIACTFLDYAELQI